jgi:hypothetical protein
LISVFKQGKVCLHDKVVARLDVEFSKSHLFFSEWLSEARSQWEPLLNKAYGTKVVLNPLFTGPEIVVQTARRQAVRSGVGAAPVNAVPAKAAQVNVAPVSTVAAKAALEKEASAKNLSFNAVPAKAVPVNVVPASAAPANAASVKAGLRPMPVRTAPAKAVPVKGAVPGKPVPGNKGGYQGRPDYRNQQRGAEIIPFAFAHEPVLDVSDETIWKKAAMVRRYFPGECREVRESV